MIQLVDKGAMKSRLEVRMIAVEQVGGTLDSSIHDTETMIQDSGSGSRIQGTVIAVEQVGGVRRGRDVASHPRLACPMLQHCMPHSAL